MLDRNIYNIRKNYPLWMKVEITKRRIEQWIDFYGENNVYVAFSGGKDSSVLVHIVRSMYPNTKIVFSNTGLEFPEIVEFVKLFDNLTIVRPKKSFKTVIEEKGYPIISKSVANCVRLARKNIAEGKDTLRVRQIRGLEKGSKFNKKNWEFLLNAPFKISEECCNELKKKPMKLYEKETGQVPIVGTMADEGRQRQESYLKTGCNAFNSNKSQPLSFWTEQDILEYIVTFNIKICSIYGDIKQDEKGKYYTTGEHRTGCIYCGFGAHMEKGPNRYQRLKETHPNLYDYCINKLNLKEVLDYINIKY